MKVSSLLFLSSLLLGIIGPGQLRAQDVMEAFTRCELEFESDVEYDNPLYDVSGFYVELTAPTGRRLVYPGFWDGGRSWKVRFAPDEAGSWSWTSRCSDTSNRGLHGKKGVFECTPSRSELRIRQKGGVRHMPGRYYLSYGDGTPFFWLACTAWNGGLLARDEDWKIYLQNRKSLGFSAIQFVTTQWRGGTADRQGDVAFTGSGKIEVNPDFFAQMDRKVDMINDQGLLAVPVLLWALPVGSGMQYSPGYYLPIAEAVKLARYIVARYQGNQVVWFLGGDGKYDDALEDRWKAIGDGVFDGITHAPATLHPKGKSFIGDLYEQKSWYNIMGYQSSHSYARERIEWITRGPIATRWSDLKPMPWINIEPLYENIRETQTEEHVRNAIWWSLFAAPVAGVTYGANGIWSWIGEDGEQIENHRSAPWTLSWENSLQLPVGQQMQYVADFVEDIRWWELYPRPDLTVEQPGDEQYDRFVSLVANDDASLVAAYVPVGSRLHLRNPLQHDYTVTWHDPVDGSQRLEGRDCSGRLIVLQHPVVHGMVVLLQSK